jgi:cephalosporin hydroxylase
MPESLLDIGARMKCSKWSGHTYLPIYDELFKDRRDEALTLVEFGIADGTSLLMWAAYFPKARIIGVDEHWRWVEPANKMHHRITAHHHRQQDDEVRRIMESFQPDIVIDDAGHDYSHEIICFANSWASLKSAGLYCIEDIQNPAEVGLWIERAFHNNATAVVHANFTSHEHQDVRPDDILVVLRKK